MRAITLCASVRRRASRSRIAESVAPALTRAYGRMRKDAAVGVDGVTKESGGKTRPIGISASEDKRVQDAVREVLEAIYEQDFVDGSYGFRPCKHFPMSLSITNWGTLRPPGDGGGRGRR